MSILRWVVTAYIWTLLSFDFCMCNTENCFSSLVFLNFGRPFATACTHSNMSLKCGEASLPPPLAICLQTVPLQCTPPTQVIDPQHTSVPMCGKG